MLYFCESLGTERTDAGGHKVLESKVFLMVMLGAFSRENNIQHRNGCRQRRQYVPVSPWAFESVLGCGGGVLRKCLVFDEEH